ncbi:hypothetical protein BKI52_03035 [marine bacterium AO1-C]|nr:hypothetical protein BKI52_03035 [marine bacterium AO1-C]
MKLARQMRWIFIAMALYACQPKKSSTNQLTPQQNFLQKAHLPENDSLLQHRLDSLHINAWEVCLYCQKEQDNTRKIRLISAICQKADNYINSLDTSYWGGILYRMKPFVEVVQRLKEPYHRNFMDIGSGNGEKLYAALCLGFTHSEGLEYDTTLVNMSQKHWQSIIQRQKMSIKLGNALTVTPQYYHQFDFIYLYSPIRNHTQMAQLFFTLMQQLKEGGILLEVRMVYAPELRKVSGYNIPEIMGTFALKKQNGKLYYVQYNESHKDWILLDKL